MSYFISGTIKELAKRKNMHTAAVWARIFKKHDLQFTEEARKIHNEIIAEKEKAQQILEKIKLEAT